MNKINLSAKDYPNSICCSLYRAARWIAFQERPVEETVARIVYEEDGVEWSRFDSAIKELHLKLYTGKLVAHGFTSEEAEDYEDISQDFWDRVEDETISNTIYIDWMSSSASYDYRIANKDIYSYIFVETKRLLEIFPPAKISSKESTRGRKQKFDWENLIYPEIAVYIHENGNVENAKKMAEDIYDICSQKYGEDKTPDVDYIRTKATNPITRRFKFGNK